MVLETAAPPVESKRRRLTTITCKEATIATIHPIRSKRTSQSQKLLRDLFLKAPSIKQEQLREFLSREEGLQHAKFLLEGVAHELEEMLILGSPIEPGRLTLSLDKGKLVVCDAPILEETSDMPS